ncbi:MAG: bifunctional diaminohydroxyphosphoribosylaminopyrimidine deaminase/5-amino-6-(5-phosphoribosylamino)uracil reductase RibD, partial [Bacteroidota bacterium]
MREGNPPVFEHEFWMRRCLALAERGRGRVSPNPMVGAVLVRGGLMLAEGWHDVFGGAHAERMLFDVLGDAGDLGDCILYVSLEPCSHFGKTPPCANLILEKGVGKVVVGVLDPNPKVSGSGVALVRAAGVEVIEGVLAADCRALNWSFWVNQRLGRAAVLAKWAETADGFMGSGTSDRVKISGAMAGDWVMELRRGMDAILVGVDTWNLDRPRLNVRGLGVERQPVRFVLDRGGRGVYEDGVDPEDMGPLWVVDGSRGIADILRWLYAEKGLGVVMVEGGARVLSSFFDSDFVDEVQLFRNSAIVFGEGVKKPPKCKFDNRR